MMPQRQPSYRAFAASAAVTVSPSRATIRRAEPSLSFQVVAPGAKGFDVIVATDPALFDPANAHRRTPKNFRSSRQDFQGEPIEIETGFYLLPRAFIRDMVSADPRPVKLHYVAVAYLDATGTQPVYSLAPDAMGSAPSVAIAADLVAENLSKVLGMAVDRIGTVGAAGRVMAVRAATALPDAIGGLPVTRRATLQEPARHTAPRPALVNGNGNRAAYVAQPAPPAAAPRPAFRAAEPVPAEAVPTAGGAFVDEDYAYGGSGLSATSSSFRDLDRGASSHASFDYDDGYDMPSHSFADEPAPKAAIPPLDPAPAPAAPSPAAPSPVVAPKAPAPVAGDEDALLQAVIGEGAGGRYDALSLDGGYRGRFGPTDAYFQRAHDGLRLGPHQAAQDTGELGELLLLMRSADGPGFAQAFGPDAEAMLATVNAEGPSGLEVPGGRGPRVQPVGGRDLWEDPWVDRFRTAARHAPFQAAMRGQILARRLDPLKPAAEALGIATDRGLAMLMALGIQRGAEGALAHLRAAANPFDTPARLAAALDALGHTDLGSFRAAAGLPPGDTVDAATHFALYAALRRLGPQSPVQVPDGEGVMDAMVTAAGPGTLGDALLKLRVSSAFGPTEV